MGGGPRPSHTEIAQLLTVREVAERLRVSTATVYRMCASGLLASVRVLNSIRISAADVLPGRTDR
jgi:excisionase family DNA binding protein